MDVVINSQKKFAILKYLIMFLFHSFCKNSLYQGVCIQFFFSPPSLRPSLSEEGDNITAQYCLQNCIVTNSDMNVEELKALPLGITFSADLVSNSLWLDMTNFCNRAA